MHSYYADEERANLQRLCGGLTQAERDDKALNPQEIIVPLLTLLGLHLFGDPSQSLFVRGLGEKVRVEVDLAPANTLVESDGAATVAFDEVTLFCEGHHIYDAERRQLEQIYAAPRTYTFDEVQRSVRKIIPNTTLLSGVQTVPLVS